MKKYEFTGKTMASGNIVLRQIRALKDFGDVKVGDIGGWIEKEQNLSHTGKCWIYDNGVVRGDAEVTENAGIYNSSEVFGKAAVYGDSAIYENARIYENAEIYGCAAVHGKAAVYGRSKVCVNAEIYGFAEVYENAWICGDSKVFGHSKVYGNSEVYGHSKIYGAATVCENSKIYDFAEVYENAEIGGTAKIFRDVKIHKDAIIKSSRDYIYISPVGSKDRAAAAFKTSDGIRINIGCFYGDIEEFEAKVKATHGENEYGVEYLSFAKLLKNRFNKKIPQNGHTRCEGGEQ